MLSFNIKSDNSLTVIVTEDFNDKHKERVSLFIESLFESNLNGTILFSLEPDLKAISIKMIEEYCEKLPYNYFITQKACA